MTLSVKWRVFRRRLVKAWWAFSIPDSMVVRPGKPGVLYLTNYDEVEHRSGGGIRL